MFRHVGTHVLCKGLDENCLYEALLKGRCYVSFDWIAQPRGFAYTWQTDREKGMIGDQVSGSSTMTVEVPVESEIVLLRNGRIIANGLGKRLDWDVRLPGAYRTEVYLTIAGERRPWIVSNPIYVY